MHLFSIVKKSKFRGLGLAEWVTVSMRFYFSFLSEAENMRAGTAFLPTQSTPLECGAGQSRCATHTLGG